MKNSLDETIAILALIIFFAIGLLLNFNKLGDKDAMPTNSNAIHSMLPSGTNHHTYSEIKHDINFSINNSLFSNPIMLTEISDKQTEAAKQTEPTDNKPLTLYAKAAVLMDGESGRVLYSKNGGEVLAMASTTKIMTAILALEYGDLEESVEVSKYAAAMPKVKLGIRVGERYRLRDLLFALMLESDNDAAVAVAEYVAAIGDKGISEGDIAGRSIEESKKAVLKFASLMNKKAADIGAKDTFFITPNGLDATISKTLSNGEIKEMSHSSTAADMALILKYCVFDSHKKGEFAAITAKNSHYFSDYGGKQSFHVTNHNAFLNMMDGVISGKTGFTNQAGYCYVGALERDGKKLTLALLACGWPNHKTYKWTDSRILMDYGLNNYAYVRFDIGDVQKTYDGGVFWEKADLGSVMVYGASINQEPVKVSLSLSITPMKKQSLNILMRKDEVIQTEYIKMDACDAPLYKGDVIGELQYSFETGEVLRYPAYATTDVLAIKFEAYIWRLLDIFLP